jgi:hypothetical protein
MSALTPANENNPPDGDTTQPGDDVIEQRATRVVQEAIWPTVRDYPVDESWTYTEVANLIAAKAVDALAFSHLLAARPTGDTTQPGDDVIEQAALVIDTAVRRGQLAGLPPIEGRMPSEHDIAHALAAAGLLASRRTPGDETDLRELIAKALWLHSAGDAVKIADVEDQWRRMLRYGHADDMEREWGGWAEEADAVLAKMNAGRPASGTSVQPALRERAADAVAKAAFYYSGGMADVREVNDGEEESVFAAVDAVLSVLGANPDSGTSVQLPDEQTMVDDLVDFWHNHGPAVLLNDRARALIRGWFGIGFPPVTDEQKQAAAEAIVVAHPDLFAARPAGETHQPAAFKSTPENLNPAVDDSSNVEPGETRQDSEPRQFQVDDVVRNKLSGETHYVRQPVSDWLPEYYELVLPTHQASEEPRNG